MPAALDGARAAADFVMATTEEQQAQDELVARVVGGDSQAFQELALRYYRPVGAFVLKRVERPDVVEDLVQETFLEAFRSLRAGRRPDHFAGWLFGVAHNCCGKWLRRKRPRLFDPRDQPDLVADAGLISRLEEVEEQQKELTALEAGLADLPDESRRMLELKHRQGRTCEQIAVELGKPVGTIKSLLSRTYKLLRERLRPGEVEQ
jgi:RNA polymerase sigma-70 factor (ECF subfamily)